MPSTEKVEMIIVKLETLNNLWWKAEEGHDQEALQAHKILEHEIREDLTKIGWDFDYIGAEYEDMIARLRRYIEDCSTQDDIDRLFGRTNDNAVKDYLSSF